MAKLLTAEEAIQLIPDNATVLVNPVPAEEVFGAFDSVFERTGHPKDLTLVYSAGLGPWSAERKGMNHFAYPGMLKRVIGAHFGLNHALVQMIANNECEAYNLPQGVMAQLYRAIAAGQPGLATHFGLGTFVDPRIEGGKMNERTQSCEDLIELVQIAGQEMLLYKSFPVDVGIVRGTAADPRGNITNEDEAIPLDNIEVAMAAKNTGGIVIAQVAQLLDTHAIPHNVEVPGVFVDYVVVATSPELHPHTLFVQHDDAFVGKVRVALDKEMQPVAMGTEKIIARRALQEIRQGMNVNLGVGIAMEVASVAFEEGMLDSLCLNTEVGVFGGLPERGFNFGPAKNPEAFVSQAQMFDFYDGGGLDITCVGFAQVDQAGNVNVSKLGNRVIGCGGFINLTQSTHKVIFCGEFTAGGLKLSVDGGRVSIVQEGKVPKFIEAVQQITFSGGNAVTREQDIMYVTERCVFRLTPEGLVLAEVAPGIDIERDIIAHMNFAPIVPDDVPLMDAAIFQEGTMAAAQ
ncbi:MAG: acyl CoA:acetate/3-ketoacid CoA transferase [Candidatus Hydrogenedentes bacterium]|nr:acyl CoA:acetate/3-ketoacid CoA transferase [Candidatus Hydrogenedentota bacterium]